ncbi:MAG: head-tail connector protein [Pirellulaceae bacterium]|jgi:uncharacterized phiE125 gp8 family phage protein|nr:head-tail connector protein [Pirellulaceae bacterium]
MLDYAPKLKTAPALEPVTLAEIKRQANVVATDEDSLLAGLIQAARELVEEDITRALITQTWELVLHDWFADYVQIPKPPLQSVTSIQYYDTAGVLQTLPAAYYRVDTHRQPGVIWRDDDYTWPTVDDRPNAVTITYKAGYGDAAASVPARAKQAILLLAGHWYLHREAVGQVPGEVALTYERLVRSLRVGAYP